MTIHFSRAALLAALAAFPAFAAETWNIDDTHSAGKFKVKHLMITNVNGEIGGMKGTCTTEGEDLAKFKCDATLDMKTVNTNNAKRDDHLRNSDFFDVKKFPKMTFKTKKVTDVSGTKFKLVGDLTIKDKTKEVVLDSELTPAIKDPWGNTKRGYTGTTKINRKDFGVTWNKTLDGGGVAVGDEVDVTIDMELQQAPAGKKG